MGNRRSRRADARLRVDVSSEFFEDCKAARKEQQPDASRFVVYVGAPRNVEIAAVEALLDRLRGFLRSEVAQAITRKRVPTLAFRIVPEGDA